MWHIVTLQHSQHYNNPLQPRTSSSCPRNTQTQSIFRVSTFNPLYLTHLLTNSLNCWFIWEPLLCSFFWHPYHLHLVFTTQLPLPFTIHHPIHHPLQPIHYPSLPPSLPFKPWIFITIIITILCYVYQDPQAYWVRWELDQAVAVSGISQSCWGEDLSFKPAHPFLWPPCWSFI